jgi:mono/diheme cytochrome c family protein
VVNVMAYASGVRSLNGVMGRRRLFAAASIVLGLLVPAMLNAAQASSVIERGKYLATAGNCMSCHTRAEGEPFSGGLAFATPFGTLYSTNITPDVETGIGKWTLTQFDQAVRQGVRPDGAHLYPAFPYTAFTKISDADVSALFAYLKSLTPVSYTARENELSFPASQRWALGLWKSLYFEEGRFTPNAKKSKEWNRGAYLVQGLGHCSACHSPRNFLGAEDETRAMHGGTYKDKVNEDKIVDWAASDLSSSPNGLGQWSVDELAQYLRIGYSDRAGVFGPMNEVVVNSTSRMSAQDNRAIAVYLKSLPASPRESVAKPSDEVMSAGSLLYDVHCGTCHLPTGLGGPDTGPPMIGSPVTLSSDPASLINVVLYGAKIPSTPPTEEWRTLRKWQVMEAFGDKLSDEEAAALLTFVRNSWGNQASAVSASQVAAQR